MMRWVGFGCRLVTGGIFLFACLDKLQKPGAFAAAIDHYHLVPYALLHPMAHGLPILELIVGLALVFGVLRRGAAMLAAVLTVIFIVAIASALVRGLDISCGCFHTDGGHAVGITLLLRDFGLLVLCLPPLFFRDAGPELSHLRKMAAGSNG
ncbi:DoxX family protein [bacterium CG_4_9_14_3_um_filter_65_15]|nr:MAG: DoxX family protein [bacterium CG_4_9_14_3_um_filter_65_15]